MSFRYFDVEQASEEWFKVRLGVPTASNFDRILTPKHGALSKASTKYIAELIGEQLSLIPPEGIENATTRSMKWGTHCEEQARRYYSLKADHDIFNGGFCMSECGRFGCSPDFVVGLKVQEEGGYEEKRGHYSNATITGAGELKCPQPGTQVKYLLSGQLPTEYRWQVNGHLVVTGAPWVDFLSYTPGLDPLLLRVERSHDTETLASALELFHEQYSETLQKVMAHR